MQGVYDGRKLNDDKWNIEDVLNTCFKRERGCDLDRDVLRVKQFYI